METKLFVEDNSNTDIEKEAEAGLPVDKVEWPIQVQDKLLSEHPYLSDFEINVNLKKVDEEKQIGFGSIIVKSENNEINIPIVIDNGEIKSFDTMIYQGETLPLNQKRADQIFTEFSLADGTAEDDYSASDDISDEGGYLPDEGLYTTNSSSGSHKKISSVLDEIDGEVLEDDVEKLAKSLDENTMSKLAKNDYDGTVKKALQLETINDTKGESAYKMFKQDNIFHCKEASPHEINIKKTARNAEVFDDITVNFEQAKNIIKQAGYDASRLNNLSPNNDISFTPYDGKEVEINEPDTEKVASYQNPDDGYYRTETKNGKDETGMVLNNVVDFEMNKLSSSLFFNKNNFSFNDKIVGRKVNYEMDKQASVNKKDEVDQGDVGFYVKTGSNNYWATVPFEVEQTATVSGKDVEYIRPLGENEKIATIKSPDLKKISKVTDPQSNYMKTIGNEIYFVPDDMDFVKSANQVDLIDNKDESVNNIDKKAARIYSNKDDTFHFESHENYDAPMNLEKLSEAELKCVLANHGVKRNSANKLIKKANNRQAVDFGNINFPEEREKVASKVQDLQEKIRNSVNEIKRNEIDKIAQASAASETSIDSILALALVNEDNLSKFIDNINKYEEVAQELAEMLVLSRIGANTLPSKEIKSAMNSIEEVLASLRELEIILE